MIVDNNTGKNKLYDKESYKELISDSKYEDMIIHKIRGKGKGILKDIIADLETLDSIRCFFAILFLARDQKIGLEQNDDDIMITLIENVHKDEKKHGKN